MGFNGIWIGKWLGFSWDLMGFEETIDGISWDSQPTQTFFSVQMWHPGLCPCFLLLIDTYVCLYIYISISIYIYISISIYIYISISISISIHMYVYIDISWNLFILAPIQRSRFFPQVGYPPAAHSALQTMSLDRCWQGFWRRFAGNPGKSWKIPMLQNIRIMSGPRWGIWIISQHWV